MPPMELKSRIEFAFDEWDKEFEQRERSILETGDLKEKLRQEEEQINRSLDETVAKFDELLDLLDKDHVIFPSGENLNEENYGKIVELSRVIYEEAMLALHLTRDRDLTENPKLRALKDDPDLNKYIPITSLKKKVKAHFILAELYAALGVRMDPGLEDRSARAEYKKVIEEGKLLFKRIEKAGNSELLRIRLAHDIGASYKRLFDLFVKVDDNDSESYGKVTEGEKSILHDYVKDSKDWYYEMFDIIQKSNKPFDAHKIFHTEYEFRRYLQDIEKLRVGCIFQDYNEKNKIDPETGKQIIDDITMLPEKIQWFTCKKKGEMCKYNKGNCVHLKGIREYGSVLARAEIMRL